MEREATGPGTYILVIELLAGVRVRVGKLGLLDLAAGYYLYVGSALGGLAPRLARHLRATKRLHWHIDYLLPQGAIREIWYSVGSQRRECIWAERLAHTPGIIPFPRRFGASDCHCPTHLFYSPARPALATFPSLPGEPPLHRLVLG